MSTTSKVDLGDATLCVAYNQFAAVANPRLQIKMLNLNKNSKTHKLLAKIKLNVLDRSGFYWTRSKILHRYKVRCSEPLVLKDFGLYSQQVDLGGKYYSCNPSIVADGNSYVATVRTVNYRLVRNGWFIVEGQSHDTRNFIVKLNDRFEIMEKAMVDDVHEREASADAINGFEDLRIFFWKSELWALGKAKTQAINQLRALLVSAPQEIRDRLLKAKTAECVESCARVRSLGKTPMLQTLTATLRLLAKRWLTLAEELKALDAMLESLTSQHARRLRERFGVGPQTAAVLVAVAGDNPERLKSEAALAALCGTSPLQASSGKTVRHRLNRGGDRSANNALWTIAMVRMRSDPRTRAYVDRRTKEGMSNKEIHRCLKRYIVRELYPLILADLADSTAVA
ncbi:transposase [Paraburkholderia sp. USG1]|uniref:transposase n=1 Tax=Paraburkholderia sp. USG1 TaxID=2952268 RepID=UPI0038621D0C